MKRGYRFPDFDFEEPAEGEASEAGEGIAGWGVRCRTGWGWGWSWSGRERWLAGNGASECGFCFRTRHRGCSRAVPPVPQYWPPPAPPPSARNRNEPRRALPTALSLIDCVLPCHPFCRLSSIPLLLHSLCPESVHTRSAVWTMCQISPICHSYSKRPPSCDARDANVLVGLLHHLGQGAIPLPLPPHRSLLPFSASIRASPAQATPLPLLRSLSLFSFSRVMCPRYTQGHLSDPGRSSIHALRNRWPFRSRTDLPSINRPRSPYPVPATHVSFHTSTHARLYSSCDLSKIGPSRTPLLILLLRSVCSALPRSLYTHHTSQVIQAPSPIQYLFMNHNCPT